MPKVNVVRPDGSILQIDEDQAATLTQSGTGYGQESLGQAEARARAQGMEDYYSTAGQKLKTLIEGAGSGVTLGGTDYLLNQASNAGLIDDDWRQRAQYNPKTRAAGELGGQILGALATGGASESVGLARATPIGTLSRGAEFAAEASGLGRVGQAAVRGGIEGFGFGAGAEISRASIANDPLTVESVLAEGGWGALWGAGLSAGLSKAGSVLEARAAKKAAEAVKRETAKTLESAAEGHWSDFKSAVTDAKKAAQDVAREAQTAVKDPTTLTNEMAGTLQARQAAQKQFINEATHAGAMATPEARAARKEVSDALSQVITSAGEGPGSAAKFAAAVDNHATAMSNLAKIVGMEPPPLTGFSMSAASEGAARASAAVETLKDFPSTVKGFAAMRPATLDKQLTAIEELVKQGGARMSGIESALKDTTARLSEGLGIKAKGSLSNQIKAVHEAARKSASKAGKDIGQGFFQKMKDKAGDAGVLGLGVGAVMAHSPLGILGVIGLKGQMLGKIANSVTKWAPKVTGALEKVGAGSKVDPLRTRIDGTEDKGRATQRELMKRRAEEIRSAAPMVKDTLYNAVTPFSVDHPDFASALHSTAAKLFDMMSAHVPRDPGNSVVAMKSTWQPDAVETAKFAKTWEVFLKPTAVMERMLSTGKIDPVSAAALKEFYPQLHAEVASRMLQRIQEPGVLEKMSYGDQIAMGRLLGVTIHSSHTPQFISATMSMFQQRNEPLKVRGPSISNNPSGGRPSPGTSAAQRITDH